MVGAVTPPQASALLLTGGLGTGKTAVAQDIAATLDTTDETYALIDLDYLCWAKPAPTTDTTIHDLLVLNLVPVVRGFRSAGVTRFILPRLLLTLDEAERLRRALAEAGVGSVTIVELTARDEVRIARLTHRDEGATLEEHQRLAASLTAEDGIAEISLPTDDRTIGELSSLILTHWLNKT